jgi:enediyne core biosynthesis thioesterase
MNVSSHSDFQRRAGEQPAPPSYRYRHRVCFEETNVVGNVYFARHISWQGRCRELFLHEHAPEVIAELTGSLRLVTLNVNCEYLAELRVLDEVELRMSLAHLRQHRIGLSFEYFVARSGLDFLAARGFQEIGCMREAPGGLVPCAVPPALANALAAFR